MNNKEDPEAEDRRNLLDTYMWMVDVGIILCLFFFVAVLGFAWGYYRG